MICLQCGSCCKEISPFGNPGPKLIIKGAIAYCKIYGCRPKVCRDHSFSDYSKCPVGLSVLKIRDSTELQHRYGELGLLL